MSSAPIGRRSSASARGTFGFVDQNAMFSESVSRAHCLGFVLGCLPTTLLLPARAHAQTEPGQLHPAQESRHRVDLHPCFGACPPSPARHAGLPPKTNDQRPRLHVRSGMGSQLVRVDGAPRAIRTPDLQIRSHLAPLDRSMTYVESTSVGVHRGCIAERSPRGARIASLLAP